MKKGLFLLIALILPVFSMLPLATSSQPTIHVYYSRYDSVYSAGGMKGMMFNSNEVYYTVSSLTYNNTITGDNQALHATYNRTTYLLTFSSMSTYSGEIKVITYTNNSISVYTNLPNLIRVIVYSGGEAQLVWAGISSSNNTNINTLAYINGSGLVTLEFANGTSISNVTLNVKLNSTVTKDVSLQLMKVSANISSTTSGQVSIQTQIPKRYSPIFMNVNYNGSSWSDTTGYTVTMAYFNGTITPALIWKGEGIGLGMGVMGVGRYIVSSEMIEFYGTNGTVLGYVHIVNVNGSRTFSFGFINHKMSVEFSTVKIVQIEGIKPVHAEFVGTAYLQGNKVIIVANSKGNVSSTAYVNFTHPVSVHGNAGVLVLISLNNTAKYVVVAKGNVTANVSVVKPNNVTNTTVNLHGKVYKAQEVVINVTSGYILFNVTIAVNNSAVTVYKEVNGELVQLNSSNYFVVNGKVVVFDDPSTTYYVVYQTGTQTSLTTQTSTSMSTTSTSSVSTSISTTSTSSVMSSATVTPIVPASTSSSSSSVLYIGIGVAVILIIVGIVLALRRK